MIGTALMANGGELVPWEANTCQKCKTCIIGSQAGSLVWKWTILWENINTIGPHWNWSHLTLYCQCCLIWVCFLSAEDTFLSAIINYTNSSTVHFKLSPTYVLYMACRYVLSPSYRPDMSPSERTHKVIAIVNKMVSMMEGVIQVSNTIFKIFFCCENCNIEHNFTN